MFTDRFESDDDTRAWVTVWTKALAGSTGEQIAFGLDRCAKELEWPPGSPAAFLKMMKPSTAGLGLPTINEAMMIIVAPTINGDSMQKRWRHPIVFHMARDHALDVYRLRRSNEKEAIILLTPVYDRFVALAASGEGFSYPSESALDDRSGKAVTPEEKAKSHESAMRSLNEIMANLKKPSAKPAEPKKVEPTAADIKAAADVAEAEAELSERVPIAMPGDNEVDS